MLVIFMKAREVSNQPPTHIQPSLIPRLLWPGNEARCSPAWSYYVSYDLVCEHSRHV